jgi:hypothetical protein
VRAAPFETRHRWRVFPGVVTAVTDLRPADVGFGELFSPVRAGRHPSVLVLGGSDGGIDDGSRHVAQGLAQAGYPALAVAYFGEPGLPGQLESIPLEYFAGALRWLARRPGVDPKELVTWGVSRGSEAALSLGSAYPKLVHAVAALVPSNVAVCSFPGCRGPAWTVHGAPLPYVKEFPPRPADEVSTRGPRCWRAPTGRTAVARRSDAPRRDTRRQRDRSRGRVAQGTALPRGSRDAAVGRVTPLRGWT